MKKKILIVMESLGIGGAEKSLVTMLSALNYQKYQVDLFLFRHEGEFMNQIPQEVRMLPEDTAYAYQKENFKTAWLRYATHGDWARSYHSFSWLLGCIGQRVLHREQEYYGWQHLKQIWSAISGEYDVTIGYLEKFATYYVVDKVNSKRKIAFMHTDYDAIPHDENLDAMAYKNLDTLVVVSEHTAETMNRHYPFLNGRIKVIKNMVSPELIERMAKEQANEMANCKSVLKIVTVGRLTPQKNIDGAITTLKMLREAGVDAEWFVVGEGESRKELKVMIQKNGLEPYFHLIGARANPYPYMKTCDVYVQPSRWEGFGITVAEAKALCKPIVVSDIPEFREQILDGQTGFVGKSDEEIAKLIKRLADEPKLRGALTANLKRELAGWMPKEIEVLEELLDE